MSDEWQDRQDELARNTAAKARYAAAQATGDFAYRTVWAGEALDMIHDVQPAGAIVERLVGEAVEVLARRFD